MPAQFIEIVFFNGKFHCCGHTNKNLERVNLPQFLRHYPNG